MPPPVMIALYKALETGAASYEAPDPKPVKSWFPRPLWGASVNAVIQAIRNVPEIHAIAKFYQFSLGSSTGIQISPRLLASGLIRRTRVLGSAIEATTELLDLIQADRAECRITLVLAGVQIVEAAVEIAPGVTFCLFNDVRPPPWYKDLDDERRWPMSQALDPVRPSAALVTTASFSPVFSQSEQTPNPHPETEIKLLRMIANCIVLVVGGPVAKLPFWCEDNDPRLPLETAGVVIHNWDGPGIAMTHMVDVDRIRTVVSDYQRFRGDLSPIDVSMQRLAAARESWQRESRAIDLGVAFEAMFMFEGATKNHSPTTEIAFKLGIRAAWLVGRDFEDRKSVFQAVRKLYNLRSQAAHNGLVKVSLKNRQAVDDQISNGMDLCQRSILALLSRQDWPDWNDLALGG